MYHERIQRKLNATIEKIKRGELKIEDLSKADQKVISRLLKERGKDE